MSYHSDNNPYTKLYNYIEAVKLCKEGKICSRKSYKGHWENAFIYFDKEHHSIKLKVDETAKNCHIPYRDIIADDWYISYDVSQIHGPDHECLTCNKIKNDFHQFRVNPEGFK